LEAEEGRKVGLTVYNGGPSPFSATSSSNSTDTNVTTSANTSEESKRSAVATTGEGPLASRPIFWVFFFHDAPGSRLDVQMLTQTTFASVIKRLKIGVVCIDRPGYGNSDPHPHASLLSHANGTAKSPHAPTPLP